LIDRVVRRLAQLRAQCRRLVKLAERFAHRSGCSHTCNVVTHETRVGVNRHARRRIVTSLLEYTHEVWVELRISWLQLNSTTEKRRCPTKIWLCVNLKKPRERCKNAH
jgi:hypothetical protein